MKRIMLLALVGGLLGLCAGCGLLCGPCSGGALCPNVCDQPGGGGCGSMCEPGCGLGCRAPCRPLGGRAACGPCADPCGDPCCDPCGSPCGPLSFLFGLLTRDCWGGCGETYCGDWSGCDSPNCSGSCDSCGDYAGNRVRGGYHGYPGYAQGAYAAGRPRTTAPRTGYAEGAYASVRPGTGAPRIVSQTDRAGGPVAGSYNDRAGTPRMVRVSTPAQQGPLPHKAVRAEATPREQTWVPVRE